MTNTTPTPQSDFRSRAVWGILLIVVGLIVLFLFAFGSEAGQMTKFGLTPGQNSQALPIPDLIVPSQPTIYILAFVLVFFGAFQLARGVKSNSLLITILVFCLLASFLVWAARDKSFSLIGMLSSSQVRATPIALAALCGVVSERAGVTNIAIEGIMLICAQSAVIVGTVTKNLWIALLAAIITGGLIAAFHAFLVIRFKVDQIISGVAINIFGAGATSFISSRFLTQNIDKFNNSGTFPTIPIPLLSKIPILGPVLFENTPVVYLAIILVAVIHVVLFYTPWGLRTRAVGEHPKAADTLGVNVFLVRYINVILGGMIAGVGGAYFTIGSVGRFDEQMTAGKGFIGLAAMIFGKWTPIGAYTSSLIFGFADSLQVKLQILQVGIPPEFLLMAPYIVTMIVLTGVVGRAIAPAADGVAYEK